MNTNSVVVLENESAEDFVARAAIFRVEPDIDLLDFESPNLQSLKIASCGITDDVFEKGVCVESTTLPFG